MQPNTDNLTTSSKMLSDLVRAGRLAGMVQVCRPQWRAEKAWSVAQLLAGRGVNSYQGRGSLINYFALLDAELNLLSREILSEGATAMADELQIRRWAERWQYFSNMAQVSSELSHSLAA
ncbi:MAG: hypothetical protein OEZ16_06155 [Chromatiales bacterium]|nr:hypothetical protein [Chromatiales bacterium]